KHSISAKDRLKRQSVTFAALPALTTGFQSGPAQTRERCRRESKRTIDKYQSAHGNLNIEAFPSQQERPKTFVCKPFTTHTGRQVQMVRRSPPVLIRMVLSSFLFLPTRRRSTWISVNHSRVESPQGPVLPVSYS